MLLNFWAAASEGDVEVLNRLYSRLSARGLQVLAVNLDDSADADKLRTLVRERNLSFPILRGSDDVGAIYNILYRYLFDRHRDLALPGGLIRCRDEIEDLLAVLPAQQEPVHGGRHDREVRHRDLSAGAPQGGNHHIKISLYVP